MLTDNSKQVLFGSLFGDGSLYLNKNGINALYEEDHSLKQKDYLLWKKPFFEEISPVKVTEYSYFDERTGKRYYHIRVRTRVSSLLTDLHKVLYIDGRKTVPPLILNQIDTLGLAVLYFDDGDYCYQNRRAKISTHSFSLEENELIKNYLLDQFELETMIYPMRSGYELRFNSNSTKRLLSLIENYTPECLFYKLGRDNEREKDARLKARLWEERNKDKRLTQWYGWRDANRERYLELKRACHHRHRDKNLARQRMYYHLHRDEINARRRRNRDG